MLNLLMEVLPIFGGYLLKIVALQRQSKADEQKLLIQALAANESAVNAARDQSNTESPMAALNRRVIIFVILSLIVVYVAAPLVIDIETVIPIVKKGISFLGIQLTRDETEFHVVRGLVNYDKVWEFASIIIYFYFGSSLARGR